jgi:hypothetical protein
MKNEAIEALKVIEDCFAVKVSLTRPTIAVAIVIGGCV